MRIYVTALLTVLLSLITAVVPAQPAGRKMNYADYVGKYSAIAVKKMQEYGIPASITLAQGILESGTGNSELAVNANNHFGIKCHKEWTGMTYIKDDDEKDECFRKYNSPEESFNDHSLFLTSRPRYSGLFQLDIRDYKGWAHGLKSAGYATNPRYAEILIRIIEENELFLFDNASYKPVPVVHDEPLPQPAIPVHVPAIVLEPQNLKFIEIAEGNRPVYMNNGVKLTFARDGDDIHTIARDFGIHGFQLLRYNEMGRHERMEEGQAIYITPKKRKGAVDIHVVNGKETMHDIAQFYAIRLKDLYKHNGLAQGHEPEQGQKVKLRK